MSALVLKEYTENPHRGVFLTSEIDINLFNRVNPEIIKLRADGGDPICFFLDSPGGQIYYAEKLLTLAKTPTQKDHTFPLVTVATGMAASAAADLLALGDYAIAYPGAHIHYHGSRQSRQDITLETVNTLASSIRETNDYFALRLASRMFRRLFFHMINIGTRQVANSDLFDIHKTVSSPETFFNQLKERVTDPQKALISQAVERQKKISDIVNYLSVELQKAPQHASSIKSEAHLLKCLIDFEVDRLGENESLSLSHLNAIQEDFIQLNDFFSGRYRQNLQDLVLSRGESFLSAEDYAQYQNIPITEKARRDALLMEKVQPLLNPIWYLVVSICRLLQEGEHPLPPVDAYWLGLVDEVIGSGLPTIRALREQQARQAVEAKKAAAASANKSEAA